jgi:hypothetical protein
MGLHALAHDLETLIDDRVRPHIAETLVNSRAPGNISKQNSDFADRSPAARLWPPVKLRKCGTANAKESEDEACGGLSQPGYGDSAPGCEPHDASDLRNLRLLFGHVRHD